MKAPPVRRSLVVKVWILTSHGHSKQEICTQGYRGQEVKYWTCFSFQEKKKKGKKKNHKTLMVQNISRLYPKNVLYTIHKCTINNFYLSSFIPKPTLQKRLCYLVYVSTPSLEKVLILPCPSSLCSMMYFPELSLTSAWESAKGNHRHLLSVDFSLLQWLSCPSSQTSLAKVFPLPLALLCIWGVCKVCFLSK